MKPTPLTLPELLDRIDSYFNCSLSDEEERELRSAIAATPFSHPAIDEARALMGFRKPTENIHTRRRRSAEGFRAVIGIAAAIALILTISLHLTHKSSLPAGIGDGTCIAYVNGCQITDESDVVRLMMADLREFESGADNIQDAISDDLTDIATIIQTYETDLPEL